MNVMTTLSEPWKTLRRPEGFILSQAVDSLLFDFSPPNPSSLVTINVRVRAVRRLFLDK